MNKEELDNRLRWLAEDGANNAAIAHRPSFVAGLIHATVYLHGIEAAHRLRQLIDDLERPDKPDSPRTRS